MPLFGPPNIEELTAKSNVKGLIKALSYKKDATVREAAAKALGETGDTRVVEPLVASLGDRSPVVRKAAVEALLQMGAPPVKPLIAELRRLLVGPAATKALGRMAEPAMELLIAALKKPGMRKAAAEALGKIGDPQVVEPLIAALKDKDDERYLPQVAAKALGHMGDERAVKPLIAALEGGLQDVRQAAAEALGQIGDAQAVEPLITALKDPHQPVRQSAAKALGQIGAPAVEPLIAALSDHYSYVREAAAKTLGQIGTPAVEPLIAALKKPGMRKAAVEILDDIGWQPGQDANGAIYWITKGKWDKCVAIGAPAVEPLIAACKEKGGLYGPSNALRKIRDASAVERLIAALRDSNQDVRKAAAGALAGIGWKPGQDAIGALYWTAWRKWDKCVAIGAPAVEVLITACKEEFSLGNSHGLGLRLGQIGMPAVEPLIAVLSDEDWRVRGAAAEGLGQIGDARAIEPLIAVLSDEDWRVREAAAEGLGKIGDARAIEPLSAALKDPDWQVRQHAVWALGSLGDAQAVKPLTAALKDSVSDVRWSAAWKLGELGDARAVEPLIAALKDSNSDVRKRAARALDDIGWQPGQDAIGALYRRVREE